MQGSRCALATAAFWCSALQPDTVHLPRLNPPLPAPLPCPDLTCCPALQAALGIRFRHINVRQQYNVLGLGFEVGVQEKAVVSD